MKIAEHEVEAGGLRWFYREAVPNSDNGRPPVILLHGLVAQSYSWRDVLPALAEKGFRAYAPDWIGHGFSAKPDKSQFDYTPEAFLAALTAWIDSLALDKYSLVVQGFLGTVGLLYAAQHPDRIERLAILNTPLTSEAKLPLKLKMMGWPFVGDVMTQDPLLVDRTLEGGGPYQVDDEDLDVYRRPFLKSSDVGRALLWTIQRLQLAQVMPQLDQGFADWQAPTLIAWGLSDPWLPVSLAEKFAEQLGNVELERLEQVGHYAQEDWAEKVSAAVVTFLRKQAV
ncbi:MAG: alpha/beta fold hydrolase [Leptolyngbya sp. SIO4C1]|nr:alpha/beta fold hydrolase [Leptolyngbya sp. SIO4C1]